PRPPGGSPPALVRAPRQHSGSLGGLRDDIDRSDPGLRGGRLRPCSAARTRAPQRPNPWLDSPVDTIEPTGKPSAVRRPRDQYIPPPMPPGIASCEWGSGMSEMTASVV